MLENAWIEFTFPYALLSHHEGVKRTTIGVIRGVSAKLPHHRGIVLAYPMENKVPFVCHKVKSQGCDYIIESNKSLNART